MEYAENFAVPVEAAMGAAFPRRTEFNELFYLRWGEIRFEVAWGAGVNLKVVLHVYRPNNVVERFIIDTDPFAIEWNRHKRITRDFYLHPFPSTLGRIDCAKFSYVAHFRESSIPSQHEYIFMDWNHFCDDRPQKRPVTREWSTPNTYRTLEMDAATLQRDVDWYNRHPETLSIIPKFTKGQPHHPFHPKRYIHDQIDRVIGTQQKGTSGRQVIKVCASCIDDTDFVSHLDLRCQ